MRNLSAAVLTAEVSAATTTSDTTALATSLGAGLTQVGDTYRAVFGGTYTTAVLTANTITFWLSVGGTKIASLSFQAPTAATASTFAWRCEFEFTFRAIGSSGSVIATARGSLTTSATAESNLTVATKTPTAVATNGALPVSLGWTSSLASASDTVTAEVGYIVQMV